MTPLAGICAYHLCLCPKVNLAHEATQQSPVLAYPSWERGSFCLKHILLHKNPLLEEGGEIKEKSNLIQFGQGKITVGKDGTRLKGGEEGKAMLSHRSWKFRQVGKE